MWSHPLGDWQPPNSYPPSTVTKHQYLLRWGHLLRPHAPHPIHRGRLTDIPLSVLGQGTHSCCEFMTIVSTWQHCTVLLPILWPFVLIMFWKKTSLSDALWRQWTGQQQEFHLQPTLYVRTLPRPFYHVSTHIWSLSHNHHILWLFFLYVFVGRSGLQF